MSSETGSIQLLGNSFYVLWQSGDRRQFANREKCYELVSFQGMEQLDLDALRRGPPVIIEKCWLPNPDYKRNASREYHEWHHATGRGYNRRGQHHPPERAGFYCPPEAGGLRFINPKDPQVSTSAARNVQASLSLVPIGSELFRIPCSGPGSALFSKPGTAVFMAIFGNGDIRFLKDVVECSLPYDARQHFILESLTASAKENAGATGTSQAGPKEPGPLGPPTMNETILWHVQQQILDDLDTKLRSAPSASLVFTRYCRDQMTLAQMSRKFGWSYRTLKGRKRTLETFLHEKFGLTLAAFFVNRAIFGAAERQLQESRAKRISRRALGECDIGEEDGQSD